MHTLAVYGSTPRADATLREVVGAARVRGGLVTVLSVVHQESGLARCCGLQSGLWNEICRELGQNDLQRASLAVGHDDSVHFDVLITTGRHAADALVNEARARGADEIVLVDPSASGLGGLERRRLRRRSPVPVSA
jgi:hypothetical protein